MYHLEDEDVTLLSLNTEGGTTERMKGIKERKKTVKDEDANEIISR
jgi:hypothetical protein